jgi:hypothetical protein
MTPPKSSQLRLLLLLLGLVVLPAVVIGAVEDNHKASQQGTIRVRTQPAGATVSIDGQPPEKTTREFLLPAGRHTIRVDYKGHKAQEREIEVKAGQVSTEYFRLRPGFETITIRTDPPGATVTIDGEAQKKKAPGDYVVKVGKHRLKVSYPGYKPAVDNDFVVEKGDTGQRNIFISLSQEVPPRALRPFRGERDATLVLAKDLALVANEAAKILKENREPVALGNFTGPAKLPYGGGPLIALLLGAQLEARGVTVDFAAKTRIQGEYLLVKDKKSQLAAVRIRGKVAGADGAVLYQFDRKVQGESAVAVLLGVTARLPLTADEQKRSAALLESVRTPRVWVNGNRIAATEDSPYAIEVLSAPKKDTPYESVTPHVKDGLAYVPLKKDGVFAVKLINNTDEGVAVSLSVDGVNSFTFSDRDPNGLPPCTLVKVDAKSSVTVQGWYHSLFSFDRFTPGKQAETIPIPSGGKVGTITAVFSAAWPKGTKRPADEPDYQVWADRTTRACRFSFQPLAEHDFGVIREVVSVRYNRPVVPPGHLLPPGPRQEKTDPEIHETKGIVHFLYYFVGGVAFVCLLFLFFRLSRAKARPAPRGRPPSG